MANDRAEQARRVHGARRKKLSDAERSKRTDTLHERLAAQGRYGEKPLRPPTDVAPSRIIQDLPRALLEARPEVLGPKGLERAESTGNAQPKKIPRYAESEDLRALRRMRKEKA